MKLMRDHGRNSWNIIVIRVNGNLDKSRDSAKSGVSVDQFQLVGVGDIQAKLQLVCIDLQSMLERKFRAGLQSFFCSG